ncbi:MAG: tRNA (adenosine(37)-N6)-threonylcarbamoyltransferase complex dimerization subunit type 1 TsaB, partial [Acidobacteriota bacterium]
MSYILAIESAVYGGSATLLDGDTVVGEWVGTEPRGSSDQLLPNIQKIIEKAGIADQQLHAIAVSNGPGSYTGIRIGIATALGLSTALGIPTAGISLLEALALVYGRPGQIASAVPFGRDQIAFQTFALLPGNKINGVAGPIALTFDDFSSSEGSKACGSMVVDRSLYE